MNNINVAVSGASLVPLFCLRLRALIGMMTMLSLSLITNISIIHSNLKKVYPQNERRRCTISDDDGVVSLSRCPVDVDVEGVGVSECGEERESVYFAQRESIRVSQCVA